MYMYIICIYIYICIYTGSDFGSATLFEVTGLEGSQFRFRDAQPADGRQLRARLGSGQRFPCSVLDVPILDMGRQMTAVWLQKRKRHFNYFRFIMIHLSHRGRHWPTKHPIFFKIDIRISWFPWRSCFATPRGCMFRSGAEKRYGKKNCSCCGGGFGSWIWIEKTEGFDMFWSVSSINHTIWGTRTLNQSA